MSADWRTRAACIGYPVEDFFPVKTDAVTDEAAAACARCEVRQECLDYSLDRPEKYGTWGSLSQDDRLKARRTRQRTALRERRDGMVA